MLIKIVYLLLIVENALSVTPTWPTPDFSACDFYPKVENIINCRSNGSNYLLGYGEIYCRRFKEESKNWKDRKKLFKWVEDTGQCLQEMLYDNKSKRLDTCQNMEEFAFDVHPICYKQYGVCGLDLTDYWYLKDVLRWVDINNVMTNYRRSKTQFENVYAACIEKFEESVEDTFFNLIFERARAQSGNIRELSGNVFVKSPKKEPYRSMYFNRNLSIFLFGKTTTDTATATALYQKQLAADLNDFRTKSFNADSCFRSLKKGQKPTDCSAEMLKNYRKSGINQTLKGYEPQLTESRLIQMLRPITESH